MFSAATRHRDASDKPVNVHQPRIVVRIKHLPNMLICHWSLCGEGASIGESITAVTIMCNLVVLDVGPHLLLQEVQVRHVFVPRTPLRDLAHHVRHRTLDAAPHAAVHHDAVVHVVPQDVDRVLALDPVLDGDPEKYTTR